MELLGAAAEHDVPPVLVGRQLDLNILYEHSRAIETRQDQLFFTLRDSVYRTCVHEAVYNISLDCTQP